MLWRSNGRGKEERWMCDRGDVGSKGGWVVRWRLGGRRKGEGGREKGEGGGGRGEGGGVIWGKGVRWGKGGE